MSFKHLHSYCLPVIMLFTHRAQKMYLGQSAPSSCSGMIIIIINAAVIRLLHPKGLHLVN